MKQKKSSLNLPENQAAALSYLFGFVTAFIVLSLEPENRFVRYHAYQSLVFSLLVIAGSIILSSIPFLRVFLALTISPLWGLASFILWIFLILKTYQGEKISLPYLGDWAQTQLGKK